MEHHAVYNIGILTEQEFARQTAVGHGRGHENGGYFGQSKGKEGWTWYSLFLWGCPNPRFDASGFPSPESQPPPPKGSLEEFEVKDASDAVRGDFNALSLLEYHLVSNSAKFTEKGQVHP